MRCATGINTKLPPSHKSLNEKFFETAGPHGKRVREGDRGAAQPNHGDSEG
jgi:hypothetical protein